jgi:hypothetical protein
MPTTAASMAPVPNEQVPRLRVLVAAGREEEEALWDSWSGSQRGSTQRVMLDSTPLGPKCECDLGEPGGGCRNRESRQEQRPSIPGTKVWGFCTFEVALGGRLFGTTLSLWLTVSLSEKKNSSTCFGRLYGLTE